MIPTLETRLFNALKRNSDVAAIRELVEQDVDCNASRFDVRTDTFIFPIQLAAENDRHVTLPFLYEHRNSPTKTQLEKYVIFYINHHQQTQTEKNDALFNYTISRLLYTRINSGHSRQVFDTLITALHDYDKAEYRGQNLWKGSPVVIFLQLRIYSLFRELIDMRIKSDRKKINMFTIIEKELLHNLETYYYYISIRCIPVVQTEPIICQTSSEKKSPLQLLIKLYRCIAINVIREIEQLDVNEEYTIPTGWIRHAVCVSFRRISRAHIVIRVDNPTSQNPPDMHEIESCADGWIRIKPRVLGQLHVDNLEVNLVYFIRLIDSCKRTLSYDQGRSLIYNLDGRIHHLEEIETDDTPSFAEQAQKNCVVKCFEPGMQIRFGRRHPELYQHLLVCEQNSANLLVILSEREDQHHIKDLSCRFTSLAKEEDIISLPMEEEKRL